MNAISYIRNVGKSFGYIAVDVVKDYNPAVAALAESAKSLGSDLYQSVSDFKSNMQSKASEIGLKDEAKSIASEVKSNIFEDLKSGKWYNTERVNKAALASFESFGDFSFDDDDFGDFEFEDETDATQAEMAQDQMNTRALINSMDVVGAKTANAVATATVKSADYVVANQRESARAIYSLTSRGFGEVTKGIATLNTGVAALASIAEPINIHIQNSTNFYTRSTEYQEKSLKLLEQIAKNTSSQNPASRRAERQKNTIGDFITDGALDLGAYYEMVSKNIKDTVGLYTSLLGFGGMGGGIKNSKAVNSPISTILKAGIKGLTPKIMKKSMEEFNGYLEGFFSTMLGKAKDWNPSNPILSLLKDYLVPGSGYKNKYDTGKYIQGKVDWDGMSRKALMEVIPHQLGQIVALLSGNDQEVYDYKTGKWKKGKSLGKDFQSKKDRAADDAGFEFMSEVKAVLTELKNQNKYNNEEVELMKKQLDQFNRKAFHSDSSEFTKYMDDDFKYWDYGMDKATWEVLRSYTRDQQRSGKRSKVRKYTGSIMTGRARLGNEMLDYEADGSSIYNVLMNGATLIDETSRGRTLLGVDEYNNDIFFYLQGIYQSTTHVSDNLGLFARAGSTVKGTNITKNGKIEPVRSITVREKVNREDVEANRNGNINLNSLGGDQLDAIFAAMDDRSKSGKKLPPKNNAKLREYAMRKYNSTDGNYDKDDDLEKELEAWENQQQVINGIKGKLSGTTIGKTIVNFSESVLKILNTPAEAVSKLLNAAEVSMDRLLTGNKEDGEKGILDLAKEGFGNLFESLNEKLEDIFPIDKFKGFMDKVFGKKGADGKRSGTSMSGFANETVSSLGSVGSWFKNIFTGGGSVDQAYNGRKVTRSGIVAVSEGELIIPAEYNPFYNKKINKRNQMITESNAIKNFFGAFRNGNKGKEFGPNGFYKKRGIWFRPNGQQASKQEIKDLGLGETVNASEQEVAEATQNYYGNSFAGKAKETIKQGGKNFVDGLGNFFQRILPNEEQAKKEKGKISKVVQSALEDLGASKGAIGAGALIGGGVSLLTGGAISPILGAAIGAAGGLIVNSNKVQNALFGYTDEKGNFQEGLFKKETGEAIKKYAPNVAKGAAVGGVAGLFMGSPIVGAMVGSAIGFASKNEKFQEKLFGEGGFGKDGADSGMMSKKTQEKIKKALPNMSIGAIGGLVAGPFGLAGNIILGSALGYASSTNKFQDWLFGKEDKDGKRDGGLVGLLKDKFLTPLVDIFTNIAEQIKQSVKHTFHNLAKGLRKVLTDFMKGKVGSKVSRGARAVGRFANRVTGGFVNKVGDELVGLANHSKNKSLRKGYNVYSSKLGRNMTAKERMEAREGKGKKAGEGRVFDTWDQFLATGTEDEIKDANALVKQLIDPTKVYDDQIRESRGAAQRILENSRNSLKPEYNTKEYKKSFDQVNKFMLDGNYEEARKWAGRLRMDESSRKALLAEIDKNEKAYAGRTQAKTDSKAARKALLGNSKYRHLFGDNLSDADLMSMLDTGKNELKQMNAQEREEKKANDAIIEVPDLLRSILTVMVHGPEGISDDIKSKLSPAGKTTASQILRNKYDENGNEYKKGDTREDNDGKKQIFNGIEWEYDTTDKDTKALIEKEEEIHKSIVATAENTAASNGLLGSLGLLGKDNEEEKEETSGLFDDLNTNLRTNIIPGLAKFGAGLTAFWAMASGKLDNVFAELQMGGRKGNETTFGSTGNVDQQGNKITQGEDGNWYYEDGTQYTGEVYADQSHYSTYNNPFSSKFLFNEGRQLLTNGKNFFTSKVLEKMPFGLGKKFKSKVGGWFAEKNTNLLVNTLNFLEERGFDPKKSDEILDMATPKKGFFQKMKDGVKSIKEKGVKGLLSDATSKVKNNKLVTGISGLTDKVKNSKLFKKGISEAGEDAIEKAASKTSKEVIEETAEKGAKKAAKEVGEEAIEKATKKQIMEYVEDAVAKMIKGVDSVPFGKKLLKSIDLGKFGKELVQLIGEKVAKGSARAVADCAYAFPPAGVVLDVIFFVADFCEGWNDATEYFKVFKATTWQKIVSALACSLFGLIPFVGPLIPIGLLVDLVLAALEAVGVPMEELRAEQKAATDEVAEYNKVHGTDLTTSEYSKEKVGNKGFFEKLWDSSKSMASTNWNIAKTAFEKTTSGEYGSSFGDIISGMTGTADDNYKRLAWVEFKDKLEMEARNEMRETEGKVNETKLQNQLRLKIDTFLYTEKGAPYYKYEYDESKKSYETFKSEYETNVLNSHTSSSGATHGGSGLRRDSHTSSSGATHGGSGRRDSDVDNMMGGTGTGLAAGFSGVGKFISQRDAKYANMSLGSSDVQSKGCGPAAAVMALNQYAGNANMMNAVNLAGGYQTGAGTDASFFADYYKKHGANAIYHDGTTVAGQSNIVNSIRNGVPVVLMGRDGSNRSKSRSPFGPNNHYVVASGFDASGNLIINDPEARRGNKKYSSKILKNVSLGIGIGAGRSGIVRFGLSGTGTYPHTLRNDDTTKYIWSTFRELGYSDAATAGIMGNLQQESGMDPTRYQLNGGPGRGLAQWTVGQRHAVLVDFAKAMGRDWTDLEAQVKFIHHEIQGTQKSFFKSKGCPVDEFMCLTDPAYATEIFEKAYERAGSPNYAKRKEYAAYYYNEFSGKQYHDVAHTVVDYGTSTDSSTTNSSTNSGGILDKITSFFDRKLGSFFGIKNNTTEEDVVSTSTGETVTGNPTSIKYSGSTPVELMKSILGGISYSMDGPRDPEKGSADCSSTVRWAIKKSTGIDIGGNTADQYNNPNLKTVWYGGGQVASSMPQNIKENDILFFSRPKSDYTKGRLDRVGHVGLYIGNNKMIDHGGGGDGFGPDIKDLTLSGSNGGLIKVARLVDTSAAGSGLINASSLGKTSRAVYNRGANNVIQFNPSTGKYKVGKLYSGGASGTTVVSNTVTQSSTGTISKDVALLLKTIITLIEALVTNTNDISNIYDVLVQFINNHGIDSKTASQAKAALNNLNSMKPASNTNRIEEQLSSLKAHVDSILAS